MKPSSYILLKKYFAHLVENAHFLNDFVGYFSRELHNKQTSYEGISAPFLCLFGYKMDIEGEELSSVAFRSLNFGILFNNIPAGDYEEQYEAIDTAEQLALKVLARIRLDNNDKDHFLYGAFIKNSVEIRPVELDGSGLFGVEVAFKLKNFQSLKLNADDWKDLDNVCG